MWGKSCFGLLLILLNKLQIQMGEKKKKRLPGTENISKYNNFLTIKMTLPGAEK